MREYFVGTTLRQIEMEFDSVDIACDYDYEPNESGQRRSLVEQYYRTLDFSSLDDVRKFLNLYGNVLSELEERANDNEPWGASNDWAKKTLKILVKWISKDGFDFREGQVVPKTQNIALEGTANPLQEINSDYISNQLRRINESLATDVMLAIGSAKELVETISKTILDERQIHYSNSDDVGDLVKKVRKALKLLPDDIDDKAKGSKIIKVLLSNLGNIAHVMAELRNLYGTGHGKSGQHKGGLSQRHARLTVGAASTLVTFLYETHLERDG